MTASTLDRAREFLRSKRIALVGVSRDGRDFSRFVLRELASRGYDVVPVNPAVREIDGRTCFPRVQDVTPRPDAALVMTAAAYSEQVVRDCLAAGVRKVWLHRGVGRGSASEAALTACAAGGIEPVVDLCPFMALPGASFPHRVHGFVRRRFGTSVAGHA